MISVVQSNELPTADRQQLSQALANYYSASPGDYYAFADQGGADYSPRVLPFHADLVARVTPGMSVLEQGCGSAHLCPYVEQAGGRYTGVDHGTKLLEQNRKRFPQSRFLPLGTPLAETFDIVASLYTIEHVVEPTQYLETMWLSCKAGGLLAIICPDFIDGSGLPPSFIYGKTPRRLREKLKGMALADVGLHLLELCWVAPRWKARARAAAPGAFWINRRPRILCGANYSVDADAAHLPRLRDIVWWLEQKGASIITTSRSMPGIDPAILRYNCYAVARKPEE